LDYFTILGFGFFGIGSFLSLFFILRKGLNDDGYLFLYFLLFLLSYELFYKTLINSKLIYSFPNLYISGRFFNLLIYPVFLFFVLSITRSSFRLRVKHWILLGAIITFILINYFPSLSLSIGQKLENLDSFYKDTRPGPYNYWKNWQTLLKGTIIPLVFVSLISLEFYRFTKDSQNRPKKILLYILLIVISSFFLFNLFSNLIYKKLEIAFGWSMIEWPVDIFFLSVVIALLSLMALFVNSGVAFLPPSKYASSFLNESSYDEMISEISRVIKEKELYKQFDFNLQLLSDKLNSNSSYISQAINHGLGMRFNDYINQFRIEETKRQLLSSENKHLTIEAISEQCGFKSKSTFFRAFKKEVGLTPKQFIDNNKKSSN
jgi:AraC-like DNA-binding protein